MLPNASGAGMVWIAAGAFRGNLERWRPAWGQEKIRISVALKDSEVKKFEAVVRLRTSVFEFGQYTR
jgi:hypothetical protein